MRTFEEPCPSSSREGGIGSSREVCTTGTRVTSAMVGRSRLRGDGRTGADGRTRVPVVHSDRRYRGIPTNAERDPVREMILLPDHLKISSL